MASIKPLLKGFDSKSQYHHPRGLMDNTANPVTDQPNMVQQHETSYISLHEETKTEGENYCHFTNN